MLMRFDPFREMDRLTQQLVGSQSRSAAMPMDAYRHGNQFIVHFDLPGAESSDIDVSVDHDVLTVKAERSWPRSPEDEIVVQERPQGTFTRRLFLGQNLDTDRIEARYEGGVLSLTIPVTEPAAPRRVEISGGTGAPASAERLAVSS